MDGGDKTMSDLPVGKIRDAYWQGFGRRLCIIVVRNKPWGRLKHVTPHQCLISGDLKMKTYTTSATLIAAFLASAFGSTLVLAADPMLSTGGYATEMHQMEMMKMLDADGNHMVTKSEFDRYYGNIFDELDKNKDGNIDATEWAGTKATEQISLATGGYSRELRSMKMMSFVDKNNDHKVSKDEFIAYHDMLFKAMDKSGDNQIDPQEWLAKQTGN
jgi:Ca2+-binding EF-hand superfamily protein